mmetsp:Transcript_34212/g.96979  ORF Transcript_34212/g.96979 Transcript_34212/m.96979 type:complete len:208 (-) Transcript_34212:339-962(-)
MAAPCVEVITALLPCAAGSAGCRAETPCLLTTAPSMAAAAVGPGLVVVALAAVGCAAVKDHLPTVGRASEGRNDHGIGERTPLRRAEEAPDGLRDPILTPPKAVCAAEAAVAGAAALREEGACSSSSSLTWIPWRSTATGLGLTGVAAGQAALATALVGCSHLATIRGPSIPQLPGISPGVLLPVMDGWAAVGAAAMGALWAVLPAV